jgi:transposase
MTVRDELGAIFEDEDFAHLFPSRGRPAMPPWRLALLTIMQFAEGLSDRQAVDAVRARIDWKYALSLELADSGFYASVLCEFRSSSSKAAAPRGSSSTICSKGIGVWGFSRLGASSTPTPPASWLSFAV